ncbi:MAG: hypothetical protein HYW45_00080 [Candidatus Daviesbacteria bacterium]|nr:MAG: hypothetical protein HYW45_00080 [Candidatus Daviesbacteria bacterium]
MSLVVGVLQETFFLVIHLILNVVGVFVPLNTIKNRQHKKRPVVFIHGWFTRNPLYFVFKKHLENEGLSVYMVDLGLQLGDTYEYAKKLKNYIEKNKLSDITLVGVSLGAVISLIYLQKLNGWAKTKEFVSIGGSFKGSPLTFLAPLSKSARQVTVGSKLLSDLTSEDLSNHLHQITNLYAKYDEFVPRWSSTIEGAKNIQVNVMGHTKLQAFSKEVYRKVATIGKS